MKERTVQRDEFHSPAQRVGLKVVTPSSRSARSGIEVHEEELGSVSAQRMYKLRCECGRSWFELELPKLVKCPACAKLCLVSS